MLPPDRRSFWRLFLAGTALPLAAIPVLCRPQAAQSPKAAYELMQKLVADALEIPESTGRTRLAIANGVITYDFRPEPLSSLASRPDRMTGALELLIRAAALRRDFRSVLPAETFWTAPLQRTEALAAGMIGVAYAVADEKQCAEKQQALNIAAQAEYKALENGVRAYAQRSGLGTVGSRGFSDGFQVEVLVEPPKAKIRYMPFLDYKRCQYFNLPLDEHWNDLNSGTHNLIGHYRYRAEWPASLNGPEEGNFNILRDTKLTFTPKVN